MVSRLKCAALLFRLAFAEVWHPSDLAVSAAQGSEVRCLHREQKSDAFFHFYDHAVEAAVYATPTETEADAVEVTGLVTGFNVELLEKLADEGGWRVKFYVMCNEAYACATNMTNGALPDDEHRAMLYLERNTSFDCLVTATTMGAEDLPMLVVADFLQPPTLKTGRTAFAPVPELATEKVWTVDHLTSWRKPFSDAVWAVLAAALFLGGAFYGLVVGDENGGDASRATQSSRGVYRAVVLYTQGGGFEPTSGPARLFAAFFSFFTLLTVSAYTANLTSFLTVTATATQKIERIRSFSEFSKRPCYYGASTKKWLAATYPNMRVVDLESLSSYEPGEASYCQLFRAVRNGECDGVVTYTHYARHLFVYDDCLARARGVADDDMDYSTTCDIEPTGPEESVVYYSVPFRYTDGPIKAAHDWLLALLTEENYVATLQEKYFPSDPFRRAGCDTKEDDADEAIKYDMADMAGYFLIALAAVVLGSAGYGLEKLVKRRRRGRRMRDGAAAAGPGPDDSARSDADSDDVAALRRDLEELQAKLDDRVTVTV